ncbi:unnamed protein product [Heligmosomoides polygyrus]|uniref:DDE_3 domain-containing protein n=1 Tax=Heligmosomoides polygyrus TaxID=6339 RepID=A0A183GV92_HELPZ|nr:unnamed protein product [Heligmosomoides polygyrus]
MVTFILAMNTQGVIHTGIIDDGTCTDPMFCAFVEELASKMRGMDGMDGVWLIMDNARIHQTSERWRILEKTSYELKFLSPYSYMLNPAENVFSKVKACETLAEQPDGGPHAELSHSENCKGDTGRLCELRAPHDDELGYCSSWTTL